MNPVRMLMSRPAVVLAALAIAATQHHHTGPAAVHHTGRAERPASVKNLGVGLFVWHLAALGGPEDIAQKASEAHVGSLYIKAADGSRAYNGTAAVYATARACSQRGIQTLAWAYTRATDPEAESRLDISLLHGSPDIHGIVLDIEDAVIRQGTGGQALAVLRAVRAHRDGCSRCQGKWVGAALPACPSKAPSIPTQAILSQVDFACPMAYWGEQRLSVRTSVHRMFREYLALERQTRRSAVLVPLGLASAGGSGATAQDIAEFTRRTSGYYGIAFWSFDGAVEGDLLGAVSRAAAWRAGRTEP